MDSLFRKRKRKKEGKKKLRGRETHARARKLLWREWKNKEKERPDYFLRTHRATRTIHAWRSFAKEALFKALSKSRTTAAAIAATTDAAKSRSVSNSALKFN